MQSPQGMRRSRLPARHVHQPQEAGTQVSDTARSPGRGCLAPKVGLHDPTLTYQASTVSKSVTHNLVAQNESYDHIVYEQRFSTLLRL